MVYHTRRCATTCKWRLVSAWSRKLSLCLRLGRHTGTVPGNTRASDKRLSKSFCQMTSVLLISVIASSMLVWDAQKTRTRDELVCWLQNASRKHTDCSTDCSTRCCQNRAAMGVRDATMCFKIIPGMPRHAMVVLLVLRSFAQLGATLQHQWGAAESKSNACLSTLRCSRATSETDCWATYLS